MYGTRRNDEDAYAAKARFSQHDPCSSLRDVSRRENRNADIGLCMRNATGDHGWQTPMHIMHRLVPGQVPGCRLRHRQSCPQRTRRAAARELLHAYAQALLLRCHRMTANTCAFTVILCWDGHGYYTLRSTLYLCENCACSGVRSMLGLRRNDCSSGGGDNRYVQRCDRTVPRWH